MPFQYSSAVYLPLLEGCVVVCLPRLLTMCLFAFSPGKETKGNFNRTVTTGGFFIPAAKLHSTSPGSSCDLSKQEGEWGQEGMPAGAEGGFDVSSDRSQLESAQARPPPEQLKVFRPIEDPESEQTAPKMLGMFYTSNDNPSKSVFTSSLFQMEPSPRHQRKALNISEPFAVSVPLRVSAVISTNSTPCRTPPKELQSLSSLEEFSFQGSESGGWPEDDKPLGAETSAGKAGEKGFLFIARGKKLVLILLEQSFQDNMVKWLRPWAVEPDCPSASPVSAISLYGL